MPLDWYERDFKQQIGYRLKRAREVANLTAAQLSKESGIDPAQISHYESGERAPSVQNLFKLCAFLGVESDFILGLTKGVKTLSILRKEEHQ